MKKTYDERCEWLSKIAQQIIQLSIEQNLTIKELTDVLELTSMLANDSKISIPFQENSNS